MKLQTQNNKYVASNNYLEVSEDLKNVSAESYGWWKYLTVDKIGNVFFNDYNYSSSTNGHQRDAKQILNRLGIEIDFTLQWTDAGLGNIGAALKSEIEAMQRQYSVIEEKIHAPRSTNAKNRDRLFMLDLLRYRIADVERVRTEYLDKRAIPKTLRKDDTCCTMWDNYWIHDYNENKNNYTWRFHLAYLTERDKIRRYQIGKILIKRYQTSRDEIRKSEALAGYFKKPNGKLRKDAFKKVYDHSWHHTVPETLEPLKALLDVRTFENQDAFFNYPHLDDTLRMIPDADTVEYRQLQSWIKRMCVPGRELNVLHIEKLHTYLTNKMNRKEYVPREPERLPVSETLKRIQHDKLRLIETDIQLRSEGRRQSHCIGGANYLEQLRRGYQALNFRDYTFFLDPSLRVIQANGRHNCSVPINVREELRELIQKAA